MAPCVAMSFRTPASQRRDFDSPLNSSPNRFPQCLSPLETRPVADRPSGCGSTEPVRGRPSFSGVLCSSVCSVRRLQILYDLSTSNSHLVGCTFVAWSTCVPKPRLSITSPTTNCSSLTGLGNPGLQGFKPLRQRLKECAVFLPRRDFHLFERDEVTTRRQLIARTHRVRLLIDRQKISA
jgi:hypothetical protein